MDKQLTTPQQGDLIPEWMRGDAPGTGLEDIGQDDIATPRLVLLQALSPELEDHDGARAGEFWHSGVEQSLGGTVNLIPLRVVKRYVLWRPRPEGGILTRASDGVTWDNPHGEWDIKLKSGKTVKWRTKQTVAESRLAEWGSSDPDNPDSQPAATLQYALPCLIAGKLDLGPAVMTLQRSGIKVAKKLLGRLKLVRAPIFGLSIPVQSVKETGPEGPYYNVKFGQFGFVDDQGLYGLARGLSESFRDKPLVVKDEDRDHDTSPDAAANRDF